MKGTKLPDIPLDELEKLGGLCCTREDIAGFFNMSVRSLARRIEDDKTKFLHNGEQMTFAEVLECGKAKGRVSLRRAQFAAAQAGDRTMLVWLGKQILGQRDNYTFEHTGKDGRPLMPLETARQLLHIADGEKPAQVM